MTPLQQLSYKHNCSKAITIKQPWAWLIIYGDKDVENRTWYTEYVGSVFVHASKTFDQNGYEYIKRHGLWRFTNGETFRKGGIIGIVEILTCTKHDSSDWFEGPYGFLLANAKPVPFTSCRGQLGIWDINHPDVNPFNHLKG